MTEYIQYFPKPLLDDIIEDRCLPIIGAGFSLNAKVPNGSAMVDWNGLGNKVAEVLPETINLNAIEALSAYSHEFSRVKLIEFISSTLLLSSIQPGLVHKLFCKLPFEKVVTTNFDFLLEQAYSINKRYCIPVISEEQLSISKIKSGVKLYKLHGDIHHPERLIVTEDDYDGFLSLYPLYSTYLSSLLIENTALFVGYSLDDPDFRQIWHIVKERLGKQSRPGYVIQVDSTPHIISRYERRGVTVINLPIIKNRSFTQTLECAFQELLEYWPTKLLSLSTSTESDPQSELSLPAVARGRLAFFSVPTKFAAFYKSIVYPIVERNGYTPIMAIDVITPGDNITAKVFALIQKSTIVIADLGTVNTINEVEMILSNKEFQKPVLIITDSISPLSIDIQKHFMILKPDLNSDNADEFIDKIEKWVLKNVAKINPISVEEPERLLNVGEYRASVISVFSLLEYELRMAIERVAKISVSNKLPLNFLIAKLRDTNVIHSKEYVIIRQCMNTRNLLVHSQETITEDNAKNIVTNTLIIINRLRKLEKVG